MKIEVRLFATFRSGRGKKVYVELSNPTPLKVIEKINLKKEDIAILLINGRTGSFDKLLQDGDYISIFPPIGGG